MCRTLRRISGDRFHAVDSSPRKSGKFSSTETKMVKPGKSRGSLYDHVYVVIMAGGSGTRFWPLSRRKTPKQLLDLFGGTTLLEQTVERVQGIVPPEQIYVFANSTVRREMVRLLPPIPQRQIVAEPAQRNTAPTIDLAAQEILRRDPEGIMVILPADHVIRQPGAFRAALKAGCRWAATEGRSVVLGIQPTRPERDTGTSDWAGRLRAQGEKRFFVWKPSRRSLGSKLRGAMWPPDATCGTLGCSFGGPQRFSVISKDFSRRWRRAWRG